MDHSDIVMTTWGSLLEVVVVRPREPGALSHPWPDLGGGLEGDLGLIYPYHKWHEPNVPLDGTVGWSELFMRVLGDPGPMTLLTAFESGTQRFLGLLEARGELLCLDERPYIVSGIFVWGPFSSLPWYTLKANTKTSACRVRDPLSGCLSLS